MATPFAALRACHPADTPYTTYYSYDLEGQLVSSTDADGRLTTYQYNAAGQLTQEVWFNESGEVTDVLTGGSALELVPGKVLHRVGLPEVTVVRPPSWMVQVEHHHQFHAHIERKVRRGKVFEAWRHSLLEVRRTSSANPVSSVRHLPNF